MHSNCTYVRLVEQGPSKIKYKLFKQCRTCNGNSSNGTNENKLCTKAWLLYTNILCRYSGLVDEK